MLGAPSVKGYGPYGRWFATWGYVTVVVAFNDNDAAERAGKYPKVIDWAHAECERKGSPLFGLLDKERVASAGHSRGGFAALVAGAVFVTVISTRGENGCEIVVVLLP